MHDCYDIVVTHGCYSSFYEFAMYHCIARNMCMARLSQNDFFLSNRTELASIRPKRIVGSYKKI